MIKTKKVNQTILLLIILFSSSCASVLNRPVERIFISGDTSIKSINVRNAISISGMPFNGNTWEYFIPRSPDSLTIEFILDTTKKHFSIEARKSFGYWLNILYNGGLGMLVDNKNNKKYGYPRQLFLALKDTGIIIRNFSPPKKGSFDLAFTVPLTTFFNIKSPAGHLITPGIPGFELGANFFYKQDKYISLNLGAATNGSFAEHFGAGYFEKATALVANLNNNHVFGRFDLGYGINISQFIWRKTTLGDTVNLDQSFRNTALGFNFSAQYRVSNHLWIGLGYSPDFFSQKLSSSITYQHTISLNLIFKIHLAKSLPL